MVHYMPGALPDTNKQKHTGFIFSASAMTPEGYRGHHSLLCWLANTSAERKLIQTVTM